MTELGKAKVFCNDQKGEYDAEIKQHREKRSLDANAYAWVIITKIADSMRPPLSKDDVYLMMLKRYGQTGVVKILNEDAERFKRQFKYVEEHEKLVPEDKAQYFRFWVGSSNYNTAEMSIFIDGIVNEAEEMGIGTITPDELERMKTDWK
jgi:hypothetical protein